MWKLKTDFILIAIAIFHCFLAVVEGSKLQTFTAEYGPFNQTYYEIFHVIQPARICNDTLQVTLDSADTDFRSNNSARILLKQRFKLWEECGDGSNVSQPQLASFNTSFLFNVFRPHNDTAAEGLAFMIAPNLLLPPNSFGHFLGLTNTMGDSDATNKFVAVEFDTSRQYFDPDDNHVGIDINNIKSIKTESLASHNITIAPTGRAKFYNVWVDYDGLKMVIVVYITEQPELNGPTPPKPVSPILSTDLDLRDHVNQYGYLGFSASTGIETQLKTVLRWNLTIQYFSDSGDDSVSQARATQGSSDKGKKMHLGVGLTMLLLLLLLLAAGFVYRVQKRRVASSSSNLVGALMQLPATPREFRFRD